MTQSLARHIDALATVLLIGLLVTAELLRAHGGARARLAVRPLLVASLPLLVAFVVIVVARATGSR
jgi:hypothetical protein